MIDYDEDDKRTFVIESAIINKLGTPEEIRLYEQLSLALELMQDNSFNVADSEISNGINFGITTKFPHELPEKIGLMFFNINTGFDVSIKETSKCVYAGERYFAVNIQKDK
ncbi:MAG: hypothetical protein JW866_00070 [Ignavibacteriales bacterium]|nr:hypothetical protein [Ignavibacteriales bacterium]